MRCRPDPGTQPPEQVTQPDLRGAVPESARRQHAARQGVGEAPAFCAQGVMMNLAAPKAGRDFTPGAPPAAAHADRRHPVGRGPDCGKSPSGVRQTPPP